MKIENGGNRQYEFRKISISPGQTTDNDCKIAFSVKFLNVARELAALIVCPVCPVYPCLKSAVFNPLMPILKLQNNGPLYCNTVIGTLPHQIIWSWYTGRWWVGCYIWYSKKGPGRAGAPPSPLLAVPNVTAHPSTASVPTSYYLMRHYNCLWTLKG